MDIKWHKHDGHACPFYSEDGEKLPEVYIRYRNGEVIGPIEPTKRRWERWPWGNCDYDITEWRLA